jgi:phage gp36-like protein
MPVIAPTAYATVTDLAQLGVAPAALAAVTVPNQQAAIDAANALADGYLGQHFRMPLTSWGKDLVAQVCRIAAYDAIVVRGSNPNAPGVEDLHDRWAAAIRWFEQVAAGKITPTVVDSSANGNVGAPFVESVQTDQATGNFVVAPPVSGRGW